MNSSTSAASFTRKTKSAPSGGSNAPPRTRRPSRCHCPMRSPKRHTALEKTLPRLLQDDDGHHDFPTSTNAAQ